MSPRADKARISKAEIGKIRVDRIGRTLSARNHQIFAALTRNIFDAYEAGQTIQQLCQDYGLREERLRGILKEEKRIAESGLSACR
jgi:hypothetical protein